MSFVKRLSPLVTVKRKTNPDKVPTEVLQIGFLVFQLLG